MMVPLTALWLPIVLSAVAVFIASSLIHMVIGWHNADYAKLPDEDAIRGAMRDAGLDAGEYFFPRADTAKDNMGPEMQAKVRRGTFGQDDGFPEGAHQHGQTTRPMVFLLRGRGPVCPATSGLQRWVRGRAISTSSR